MSHPPFLLEKTRIGMLSRVVFGGVRMMGRGSVEGEIFGSECGVFGGCLLGGS